MTLWLAGIANARTRYRMLVAVATVRGGAYGGATPREGWNIRRPSCVASWPTAGADLTIVEREFTLVGVNPALDPFTEQPAQMHAEALRAAREAGRALGAVHVPA